jgi:hypothetical protein
MLTGWVHTAGGIQNIPPVRRLQQAVPPDDRRARHAAHQPTIVTMAIRAI